MKLKYSDIQRADGIIVVLPAKAGEKRFKYEQKVKLINPKITAEGKNVRGRGCANYILTADDMLPAEETNHRGADVEWYIKADDIVLKNEGGQSAGNPQNHAPQGQQKK